jgi:hypothetical protein
MAEGKWTEKTARAMIERNGGKVGAVTIQHNNPGIKVLGAIDYLCRKHGYEWHKG